MSDTPKPKYKTAREAFETLIAPARDFLNKPLPEGVGFFHVTGSLCLFMAAVQVITGIMMAFYYTPSPDVAYESIMYVREKVMFGKIIHGMHHWGASGFVVAVFIHMIRVFTFGAYKGDRKWTWVVGVALLGVVLGFGFTGYLLPWDMKAYFGTMVGTNIAGKAPVVGPYAREFLLGGAEISELTMPRFYAIHVMILPALLVALIGAHLYFIQAFGIAPPWKREGDTDIKYTERFFPHQALRDSIAVLVALLLLLFLAGVVGANLGPKADPSDQSFAPHPEWYFLWLQELLRYFEGDLEIVGTVILPGFIALVLLLLPFIDRNPEKELRKRPFAMFVGGGSVLAIIVLTVMGYMSLRHERVVLQAMNTGGDPDAVVAAPAPAATVAEGDAESGPVSFDFTSAQISTGEALYARFECAECHGPEVEGVGKDENIPPDLAYMGSRFKPEWTVDYMQHVPRRRYKSTDVFPVDRMPDYKLTRDEAMALTAFMHQSINAEIVRPIEVELPAATDEVLAAGAAHYESEACAVCHKLNGDGVNKAPDLTGVGDRLTPEFIYAIIQFPQEIIPGTAMEDSWLEPDQIAELTVYLMNQKAPGE